MKGLLASIPFYYVANAFSLVSKFTKAKMRRCLGFSEPTFNALYR